MMSSNKIGSYLKLLTILSIVTGFVGYCLLDPFWLHTDLWEQSLSVFNSLYMTIRLFIMEGPDVLEFDKGLSRVGIHLVNASRFLAPLSLAGGLLYAMSSYWKPVWDHFRILRVRNKTIIVGNSDLARNYLDGIAEPVVTLTIQATHQFDRDHSQNVINYHIGNASDVEEWGRLFNNGRSTVVLLEDDQSNLEILMLLKQIAQERNRSSSTRVFCHIENEYLYREMVTSGSLFEGNESFEAEPFNIYRMAARKYFHESHIFYDLKERKCPRAELVFIGWDKWSLAFLEQFMKISSMPNFAAPNVKILAQDKEAVVKECEFFFRALGDYLELQVLQAGHLPLTVSSTEISSLTNGAHFPIFFVADHGVSQQALILQIKGLLERECDDMPSRMICAGTMGSVDFIVQDQFTVSRYTEKQNLFTLEILNGSMDQLAKNIHNAYAGYAESAPSWEELNENFRNANRRAADAIKTKFEYVGIKEPLDNITLSPEEIEGLFAPHIEELAIAEHDSWTIDRLLNGWVYGSPRDNLRRRHPNIVPYDLLTEAEKDLDRKQVKSIPSFL